MAVGTALAAIIGFFLPNKGVKQQENADAHAAAREGKAQQIGGRFVPAE